MPKKNNNHNNHLPKQPRKVKPSSRTSTITNTMYASILPFQPFDDVEAVNKFNRLGERCIYCDEAADTWDHLYGLIANKKPTWYYHELNNMVPCCNNCNSSKGNKDYDKWLKGNSKRVKYLKEEKDIDINLVIEKIDKEIKLNEPKNIEKFLGDFEEDLENYEKLIDKINKLLKDADKKAKHLKEKIEKTVIEN